MTEKTDWKIEIGNGCGCAMVILAIGIVFFMDTLLGLVRMYLERCR